MSASGDVAKATMVRDRDIFCRQCHALIDREFRNVDYLRNDAITAMIVVDSIRAHRDGTGCTANQGWETGPWGEEREL